MRDYFYGNEADSFSFFRIPKTLITDPVYRNISTDAKLLYGLLLDRMSLSARNGWLDKQGRVYIYYTIEEIQVDLNCGHDKAGKLLSELDKKGVGLVERIRQGQGKPSRIYVKRFIPRHLEISGLEVGKPEVKTADNPISAPLKSRSQDSGKPDGNYTEKNYTDSSYTDPSILPEGQADVMEQLKAQLDYQLLTIQYPFEDIEGLLSLLADVLTGTETSFRINGTSVPAHQLRDRIRKLSYEHIAYVLDGLQNSESPIKNMRAFLLTALYNAPGTMALYYTNAIRQKE